MWVEAASVVAVVVGNVCVLVVEVNCVVVAGVVFVVAVEAVCVVVVGFLCV